MDSVSRQSPACRDFSTNAAPGPVRTLNLVTLPGCLGSCYCSFRKDHGSGETDTHRVAWRIATINDGLESRSQDAKYLMSPSLKDCSRLPSVSWKFKALLFDAFFTSRWFGMLWCLCASSPRWIVEFPLIWINFNNPEARLTKMNLEM